MRPVDERFWSKVDKSDECWTWTASRIHRGYGRFKWKGQMTQAHRSAWVLTFGPIPDGLWVLHRCDNPPCVRPDHLFLGTHLENMQDMDAKGRRYDRTGLPWPHRGGCRGAAQPLSKLDEQKVAALREQRAAGVGLRKLAREYGVDIKTASDAIHRRTWAHVA